MRRRRVLAVGAGILAGTAGCLADAPENGDGDRDGNGGGDGGTPAASEPAGSSDAGPPAFRKPDLPVPESELVRGAPKDGIPAIIDPVFDDDWSAVTDSLEDGDRVIGVAAEGKARAYPLPILNWHEVVNDEFGGPLLVTYCPLCASGVTAERRVNGAVTTFGVSGYLWQRDLVLYDEATGSLWSQVLGRAVRGPETGARLALRPSAMTTWGEWRDAHPDTDVLVPPPESGTVDPNAGANYNTDPYSDYRNIRQPGDEREDPDGPSPKSFVVGVVSGGAARAYPFRAVVEAGGVVNDRVGDLPVVVATTRESLVAYDRRVGSETLTFGREADRLAAGGSRWGLVSGQARDGPHEGTTLARANDRSPMYWFAWREFVPGTDVYRVE